MSKKGLFHSVLPVLILLAGFLGFFFLKSLKKPPQHHVVRPEGPLVEVIRAQKTDQRIVIYATGTVRPPQKIEIVPEVAGKVVWVSPKLLPGGHFAAGEVMFQIEKKDYEIALTQAKARVSKAREQLEVLKNKALVAKRQWQRLYGEKSPPSSLVFYEPQIKAAEAELAASLAAQEKAALDLSRTTVKAPFDGLILEEHLDLGYYVRPGSPVATLIGTKKTEIIAPVSQNDLNWLKLPAQAKIIVATGDKSYFYTGQAVRLLPAVEKLGHLPQVVVEVSDPFQLWERIPGRPDLAEGLFVELEIEGKMVRDVFVLPRAVLRHGDKVWVVDEKERLQIRPVTVVYRGKDTVLVRGLKAGERIIVTKLEAAAPGLKVRVAKGEAK